ncbi:glycerol kinase GlpK [Phenylobacterium kunshanense]|uniref:Glycerol kinase n=1 Tax=Phenylobacterium kunshanense TaxID=1445034 RepID=A0A328B5W5_9CAUL|nr:glycerol kinase GlpK [Phenylobacterium kunshanense]RAK62287.1 glycerol kinase [Phenylobacterium kunshanense]
MGEPLLLALDQGTTSTRAILFGADGLALGEAGRPLQQHYPQDGWVEHDAEEIFQAAVAVLKAAVETAGRELSAIAAIGITNQRETVVLWDRATGRPVHKAIVWQDRRTEPVCARLRAAGREARVTELTGLLLDPYFSGTKLAWLLDHVPGARAAAEAGELLAGTIDTWLIWKLTGGRVHATDATNASRTLLYDLRKGGWSAEMAAMLDVPLGILPEVRDCAGDFGETDAAILGRAVPIRGVAGDQQAALMGQGCVRPGEMKATYGTGCFMLINTGETAPISQARLLTTVAAQVGGRTTYALEGAIFIAGAAIQWLSEGLRIPGGPQAAEALAAEANDDLGVVLVPAFTGLGAPWWDAGARGALFGLTRDAGLPEIARAAFDACALQTRDLIEAMRADAPKAFHGEVELRIDGGMAKSPWFSQRLADLTGVSVCRATYQETTALGAALFAGVGAGIYRDPAEAAAARPKTEAYGPRMDVDPRERAYARWLDAVARVRTT